MNNMQQDDFVIQYGFSHDLEISLACKEIIYNKYLVNGVCHICEKK